MNLFAASAQSKRDVRFSRRSAVAGNDQDRLDPSPQGEGFLFAGSCAQAKRRCQA